MTKANAIKMLSKYGQVQKTECGRYWVYVGRYEVSFRLSGPSSDTITCESTRPIGELDDIQSDYFAGSYWKNLTQAVRYAERPLLQGIKADWDHAAGKV